MTTKSILGLLLITALTISSCKKDLEPQDSTSDATVTSTDGAAVNPASANANANQAMQPQMQPQMQQPNSATTTMAPPTPAPVGKGMNPAHGQPNHRCDIAVGAPLNSPPGQKPAATPQMQQNQAPTMTQAVVNPNGTVSPANGSTAPAILNPSVATAPGMNPPHGQAGHRCDIAVGAALPKA